MKKQLLEAALVRNLTEKRQSSGLPTWAIGIIAVGVVGGLAFATYKIFQYLKDADDRQEAKETLKENKKEIDTLVKSGLKPTHDLSYYNSTAATIKKLLDNCETVASEVQVIVILTKAVKNKLDWKLLVDAFGKKKIDDCIAGSTEYELGDLLRDQLDTRYSGIVKGEGFTYNGEKQGRKDTIDILKMYFDKIGVQI
jgi:hypothetical protein